MSITSRTVFQGLHTSTILRMQTKRIRMLLEQPVHSVVRGMRLLPLAPSNNLRTSSAFSERSGGKASRTWRSTTQECWSAEKGCLGSKHPDDHSFWAGHQKPSCLNLHSDLGGVAPRGGSAICASLGIETQLTLVPLRSSEGMMQNDRPAGTCGKCPAFSKIQRGGFCTTSITESALDKLTLLWLYLWRAGFLQHQLHHIGVRDISTVPGSMGSIQRSPWILAAGILCPVP